MAPQKLYIKFVLSVQMVYKHQYNNINLLKLLINNKKVYVKKFKKNKNNFSR
jgi:hypothetical protein